MNQYRCCQFTENDKPVWTSIPYRQRSNHSNRLIGAVAAARTATTRNGDWWGRRTDLESKETNAFLGIVGYQSQLRLANNHRRNRGCQNKHHDQEECDHFSAFHREPPFAKMEGSFCGAPNQSPDFSRHATLPLYLLTMHFLSDHFPLVYNKQSHRCAPLSRKVCTGSRANRRKK